MDICNKLSSFFDLIIINQEFLKGLRLHAYLIKMLEPHLTSYDTVPLLNQSREKS